MKTHQHEFAEVTRPPEPCPWCDEAPVAMACVGPNCTEAACAVCAAQIEERQTERLIEEERERREDAKWDAVDAAVDRWKEQRWEREHG